MKKLTLVLLFVLAVAFTLVGCKTIPTKDSSSGKQSTTSEQTVTSDSQTEESTPDSQSTEPQIVNYTLTIGETQLQVTSGQPIGELPEVPEKTGYTATGWFVGETPLTAETVWNYDEDKVAEAHYEANKYSLTLGETEMQVTYDATVGTLPEVPEKDGNTATGWYIGETALTADTVWNYTENKTAEAHYEANTYTLTLGETEMQVTYGQAIGELPAVPDKAGYTATGWIVDEMAISAATVWNYTENKSAVAVYDANTDTAYAVKYYFNSLANEDEYTENEAMKQDLTGTTDTTADVSASLATFPGYALNEDKSVLSGNIDGDGTQVLSVYYYVNKVSVGTFADFWTKVSTSATSSDDNPYIVLTADLDPKTENSVSEYKIQTPRSFYGIIDRNGHTISNITLYQDTAVTNQQMSVFDTFTGKLQNIGFVNIRYIQANNGVHNGMIARDFIGIADNIYVSGNIGKNYPQGNLANYRFGAMFGWLRDGSSVTNCIINLTEDNSNVYDYGFVAGTVYGSVTVNNVLCTYARFGSLFGNYSDGVTVNGTSCTNNATAMTLGNILVGYEYDVMQTAETYCGNTSKAVAMLGSDTSNRTIVTTAAQLYSAASTTGSYILLANDIDCTDYTWTQISSTINSTIDGCGHAIENLTLTTAGARAAMFRTFNGTIKNISFKNAVLNTSGGGTLAISGVIASTFTGTALNVYADVTFGTCVLASAHINNNNYSGALFGETASDAPTYVVNCFIYLHNTAGNTAVGYIAGKCWKTTRIWNTVIVKNSDNRLFGWYASSANINGTAPGATTDQTAALGALGGTDLIDTEENVIANAGSKLIGQAWVCDGTNLPHLA